MRLRRAAQMHPLELRFCNSYQRASDRSRMPSPGQRLSLQNRKHGFRAADDFRQQTNLRKIFGAASCRESGRQHDDPSPFADLSGRRAVVTGTSSGIGRAIALELARGGADVLVHCRSSISQAEVVRDECRELGRESEVAFTGPFRGIRHWKGSWSEPGSAGGALISGSTTPGPIC